MYWTDPPNATGYVSTVQLDGSGLRNLTNVVGSEAYPSSTRGGSSIVYRDGDRLFVVDQSAAKRRLFSASGGPSWEGWARLTRDSVWVYFAGDGVLHRVRRDGSGYQRVTLADGSAVPGTQPDPSLDGMRLTYASEAVTYILALGGDAPPLPTMPGTFPRWSPAGDRIAFISGEQVQIMDASGQNVRALTAMGQFYAGGLDWSADGQWIVVRGAKALELINVVTGVSLPLPYSGTAYDPSYLR